MAGIFLFPIPGRKHATDSVTELLEGLSTIGYLVHSLQSSAPEYDDGQGRSLPARSLWKSSAGLPASSGFIVFNSPW